MSLSILATYHIKNSFSYLIILLQAQILKIGCGQHMSLIFHIIIRIMRYGLLKWNRTVSIALSLSFNKLGTVFSILLTFLPNVLLVQKDSKFFFVVVARKGASTTDLLSYFVSYSFNMFNIPIKPFRMCTSFLFITIVGELLTPSLEWCFDSVYILKNMFICSLVLTILTRTSKWLHFWWKVILVSKAENPPFLSFKWCVLSLR